MTRRAERLGQWLLAATLVAGCAQTGPTGSPPTPTTGGHPAAPVAASPSPAAGMAAPGARARAEAGRIIAGGDMVVPRAAHTATRLPDGQVLIVGGCTVDGCEQGADSATAELYDPATNVFTRVGALTIPRVGHTATPLPDGRVLIAGGWSNGNTVASAEIYDPATRAFVATGQMGTPRGGHTATPLPDGAVLIAGGVADREPLRRAERFDPRAGRFTPTGDLAEPRSAHAATRLADGRVLFTGGSRARNEVIASAEVYDPATGAFSRTGDMSVARHKHAAITLRDGVALIVGGSDARDFQGRYASAEIYEPGQGRFTPTAAMAAPRFKLPDAVVALASGEALVAGGDSRIEVFDPAGRGFHPVAGSLDASRAVATATLLANGDVLIAGGYDQGRGLPVTARAWLFRPPAA